MTEHRRWPPEAWISVLAGLSWLLGCASQGTAGFLIGVLPGSVLLSAGCSTLLWPGDRRVTHFGAAAAVVGVLLGVPAMFAAGFGTGLWLSLVSAASFLAMGATSLRHEPHPADVPAPEPSLALAAKVAADEAIMADLQLRTRYPRADRVGRELEEAEALFEDRGWIEKPSSYHQTPPPLEAPRLRGRSHRGQPFEHLTFDSGYEPRPEEPGCERWNHRTANRTAHAWVLRHDDGATPRPWLLCFHGFRMGSPGIDLAAFDPRVLHHGLGLNLILPVLPLHGERKFGGRSGDGFLDNDPLDTIHAGAQLVWDARRMLSWVRAQGATSIGVYGLSLGGFSTALLSGLEDGIDAAIAGIPLADIADIAQHHSADLQWRAFQEGGVDVAQLERVARVASPLEMPCRVPHEARAIFGGVSDRIVPPHQVQRLFVHWDRPRIVWYQGAHMTFPLDPRVRETLHDTLRVGGLID